MKTLTELDLALADPEEEDLYFKNGRKTKQRSRRISPHGKPEFGTRPFLAWDGEGYSVWGCDPNGTIQRLHKYCLFGSSDGRHIRGLDLNTRAILRFLIQQKIDNPLHIHVAFSFEYDVNMILKDLDRDSMEHLKKKGWVVWNGYRIEHRAKKWFQLTQYRGRAKSISIRIYDVFSFFSCSLVAAIQQYTPDFEHLDTVAAGKDRRSQFGYLELDSEILPYWLLENQGLIGLMEQFRRTLYAADINISSWHGPGAIATYLFTKHGTKHVLRRSDIPEVEWASRCAYAGGRFELLRAGFHDGPVYSYDINSAYPYAISGLPNMVTGEWVHTVDPGEIRALAYDSTTRLAFIRLESHPPAELFEKAVYDGFPMPLFHRAKNGTVAFPVVAENWYHLNEASWLIRNSDFRELEEAWIYRDDGSSPFTWVGETYAQRQLWKAAGNPAEWAAKLGLNSLYGKMAQRIGWNEKTGEPPVWHQLEWAGFITSLCRSMLWIPMMESASMGSLISVETDGIFTTSPLTQLPNGSGPNLGQWKETVYTGMMALQSGMYWLRDQNGDWLPPKSRGIPRERLDYNLAIKALRSDDPIIRARHTTFVGYGKALVRDYDEWRTWQPYDREYAIGGDGKRFHNRKTCSACQSGMRFDEGLHPLCVGRIEGRDSVPHPLPWREGDIGQAFYDERMWAVRV